MRSSETATRIYREFERGLTALGHQPSPQLLEKLTALIDQSMSVECRTFHRATHSLGLIDPADPILTIAALFHDLVYYQVDGKLPDGTSEFLAPLIHTQGGDLYLNDDILIVHPRLSLACEIFETGPGKKLNPLNGLNELLSSIGAYMALNQILTDDVLLQVYAAIEATIPFRPSNPGSGSIFNLEKNVRSASSKLAQPLSEAQIFKTVARATDLGNRDVANFSSSDPSWFLATTWLLLPERNPKLRGVAFSVKDYRFSLLKMSEFFDFLKPDIVFKAYRGVPSQFEHEERVARTSENLSIARAYIKIKLIALGLVEALAQATGGDINMPVFLGSIRADGSSGARMEDHLPKLKTPRSGNPKVFSLLTDGRTLETNFDLRNSPLAAYIYSEMSEDALKELFTASLNFFSDKLNPENYLRHFPIEIAQTVATACSHSCPERAEKLTQIVTQLKPAA